MSNLDFQGIHLNPSQFAHVTQFTNSNTRWAVSTFNSFRVNSTDYWTNVSLSLVINYRFSHFPSLILFSCCVRFSEVHPIKTNRAASGAAMVCLCSKIVNDLLISMNFNEYKVETMIMNTFTIHGFHHHLVCFASCARALMITIYEKLLCAMTRSVSRPLFTNVTSLPSLFELRPGVWRLTYESRYKQYLFVSEKHAQAAGLLAV